MGTRAGRISAPKGKIEEKDGVGFPPQKAKSKKRAVESPPKLEKTKKRAVWVHRPN